MSQNEISHPDGADTALDSFAPLRRPSNEDFRLEDDQIHLWAVPLDPAPETVQALAPLLAPDETERAERFHFDRHRRRYIVGRGMLRRLLAGYTGHSPDCLAFDYGPKGKPSLQRAWGGESLSFNLSHSKELALYGFTRQDPAARQRRDLEFGVDVEFLRPMPDAEQIAERFFSADERDTLKAVPEERKSEAFFNCWTRKEAYIKATGDGLSLPLDSFDVTLQPGDEPRMVSLGGDPARGAEWQVYHLVPKSGYIGAAMIFGRGPSGQGWRLIAREWSI